MAKDKQENKHDSMKIIQIIKAPFGLGAANVGAEHGADRIMEQGGLLQKLQELGVPFEIAEAARAAAARAEHAGHTEHAGHVDQAEAKTTEGETISASALEENSDEQVQHPIEDERLRHLPEVLAFNEGLANTVHEAVQQGRLPLVLGGDHSIALGTLAGLARSAAKIGVIWLDAHSDLNTAESSPSGNIHGMSLAASMGIGDSRLTQLGGLAPKVKPEHIAIIGARSLDDGEKEFIRSLGIACYTMHDVDRMGLASIMAKVLKQMKKAGCQVHVSFDIDVVDPREAPGTGTPVRGGLSYREAHLAMELLYQSGLVASAELVEVNPLRDTEDRTAKLAAELLGSLLGEQIL